MPDSASLAAFRMRCWHELDASDGVHYIQDYFQLVDDAEQMRGRIKDTLRKCYPRGRRVSDDKAEYLGELLVTALLEERFCIYHGNRPEEFYGRTYSLIPQLKNKKLLCYMLVLLFWLDKPDDAMRLRIDNLMSMWTEQDAMPEDKYVRDLYLSFAGIR